MSILLAIVGLFLILVILGDAFETIVFPRRVTRRVRLARLFYRYTWKGWSRLVHSLSAGRREETYLSFYGPFSLLLLLTIWAIGLIVGFAALYGVDGSNLHVRGETPGILTAVYASGTTFFTLGLGDVLPRTPFAKVLTVIEAGMGFAFLALVIGYLPALNQSFSRRELNISMLDARAGSPPTSAEMLRRHSYDHGMEALQELLREWERWSAEFLESHLSYPVLAYFRSQHDNQSWLAALTTILDACALVITGVEGTCAKQAELTFAMARHAIVDLSIVFHSPPRPPEGNRLPASDLAYLRTTLAAAGLRLRQDEDADRKLAELRQMYEPYAYSLSKYLYVRVPSWISRGIPTDNWQVSPWGQVPTVQKTGGATEFGHF